MILALDLDGVVQTGHAEGGRWDRYLARDLGIDAAILQERFFRPFWNDIMLGRRDLYDALEACWPEMNCKASPREFVDHWFRNDCTLDRALLDIVGRWRAGGRKCVLATNQEHHRARYLWRDRGLSQHFDDMLYSAALGAQKPDAAFFDRAFERLSVSAPREIVFIDDAERNIEGARAAGWTARHYTGIDSLRAAIAEFRAGQSH